MSANKDKIRNPMQNWRKLGLIYEVTPGPSWKESHAQLPFADRLHDDVFRVYFSSRDHRQYSHTSYIEVDINRPDETLYESEQPVLTPGPIGHFDQHGALGSCIVDIEGCKFMYYIGWSQGYKAPLFQASIGLAISTNGGKTFKKHSRAALIPLSETDPLLMTSPHVFYDEGIWKMSYISGVRWEEINGRLCSFYRVCLATSDDGLEWNRDGKVLIDFNHDDECNIARPWVYKHNDTYHMWYAYHGINDYYRIGYATSPDFEKWERKDELAGITVSEQGFDDQMIGYPSVFPHKNKLYMLFNGNRFGKEGVGLAVKYL